AQGQAREHWRASGEQSVLEPEPRLHALEPGVALAHEMNAEGATAEPESDHLHPDDDEERAADQRMDEPHPPEDGDVGEDHERDEPAERHHEGPGDEEEEVRAVDQDEPQMAPAVSERRQLRSPSARVEL